MMHMQAHAESQIDLLQTYAPAVEDMLRVRFVPIVDLPARARAWRVSCVWCVCGGGGGSVCVCVLSLTYVRVGGQVLPAEMKVAKEAMLIIVCICSVNQFAVGRPPAGTSPLSHTPHTSHTHWRVVPPL
jgi:hypothetical protein